MFLFYSLFKGESSAELSGFAVASFDRFIPSHTATLVSSDERYVMLQDLEDLQFYTGYFNEKVACGIAGKCTPYTGLTPF